MRDIWEYHTPCIVEGRSCFHEVQPMLLDIQGLFSVIPYEKMTTYLHLRRHGRSL